MYYYLLILAIGVERLVELVVARRNATWSITSGRQRIRPAVTTR